MECRQLVIGETTVECQSYHRTRPYELNWAVMDYSGKMYELRKSGFQTLQFVDIGLELGNKYLMKAGKRVAKVFLHGTSN